MRVSNSHPDLRATHHRPCIMDIVVDPACLRYGTSLRYRTTAYQNSRRLYGTSTVPYSSTSDRTLRNIPYRRSEGPDRGTRTSTYYLLPTTYYILPTTYYLLPTTFYLQPTTYYLLPTAYCLLPTTYEYYLLPTKLTTTYEYYLRVLPST